MNSLDAFAEAGGVECVLDGVSAARGQILGVHLVLHRHTSRHYLVIRVQPEGDNELLRKSRIKEFLYFLSQLSEVSKHNFRL